MPEMAEDQLRSIVDGIRARLQAELDTQLNAVEESHQRALAELRETAEAEAERRWTSTLERERAEWTARLQNEVTAARSDVERTMVAEAMRARVEAEQAAAEAAAQARHEMEHALDAERARAQEQIDRIKQEQDRLLSEVERLRSDNARLAADVDRLTGEIEAVRLQADRDLDQARGQGAPAVASETPASDILAAIRAIDSTTSLSAALAAVTRAAAAQAPRAAIFVVHGSELREWPVNGVPTVDTAPMRADGREAGFLADVLRNHEPASIGPNGGAAPQFAGLPAGRSAVAVPFTLDGQPVAVLYADEGHNGQTSGAWRESIQILGRHASMFVGYLTALKTAQAMRLVAGGERARDSAEAQVDEEARGAQRYARLLISEIKLYNEGAVRVGRERRDLVRRLKAEIDRARKLYDERIPASVRERDAYFEQELVQTLADGDRSLLG